MNFESTITSIDIGSSKIRTVVGSFIKEENNNFVVLGVGVSDSTAIRKGNILDMQDFMDNLDKSLLEAEKMSGEQITRAYLAFNSSSFDIIHSKGVVAISGDEITKEDVERVLDMAKSGVEMPNKDILKVIPEYFVVDLEEGIKNPIGMTARKLEVVAHIFTMNTNILNNIKKAVSEVGIEILDIYPNLLNSPEGVLTKRQKELGVVCVDIGASTTGVTVYEEGVLIHSALIPLGGDNVTNDIALGARVSINIAEKLKLEYSEIYTEDVKIKDKELDFRKLGFDDDGSITIEYLSIIVGARYEEILQYVKNELKLVGKDGMLPEGAVIVGGASKQKGLLDLAKNVFRLPTFIGTPIINDELVDIGVNDPSFSAVIGNLILANKYGMEHHHFSINLKGLYDSIVKVFKKIMP